MPCHSNAARALPVDVAIQRVLASARCLRAAAEKAPAHNSFGDQLKKAVTNKLAFANRSSVFAESASEESSGEQIRKAVQKKQGGLPTQEQHKERVERERQRYQQLQPRKR